MLQRQCDLSQSPLRVVGQPSAGKCGLAYRTFCLTHWHLLHPASKSGLYGRFCLYTCVYVGVCTHPPKPSLHFPNLASLRCPRFFEALEQRHKAQVCVEDISDILEDHAEHHFHAYIAYCSNEVYQQRTLQKLS